MLLAACNAFEEKGRPIQLMSFGDVAIAAGADEVLTTSTPGTPILGGSSEKSARWRRHRRGTESLSGEAGSIPKCMGGG